MVLQLGLAFTGNLERALDKEQERLARAARAAMIEAAEGLKTEVRAQVQPIYGPRVAKAIRGGRDTVFPRRANVRTLNPAATVYIRWRQGEQVLEGALTGATIRAKGGDYLAIPTENVPRRRRGRGAASRMTVAEVEERFGEIVWLPARRPGVFVGAVRASQTKRGVRALRRDSSAARRRRAPLVAMFTFVPSVQIPRRLNFDAPARRWQVRVPFLVARNFRRLSSST